MRYRLKEFIAVGIDFLNIHSRDNQTQLTEDYILRKLLNFGELESEQTLGRILHNARFG